MLSSAYVWKACAVGLAAAASGRRNSSASTGSTRSRFTQKRVGSLLQAAGDRSPAHPPTVPAGPQTIQSYPSGGTRRAGLPPSAASASLSTGQAS